MFLFPRTSRLLVLSILVTVLAPGKAGAQDDEDWRTIEFETTEVTAADVALSPDGEWLFFTILGHLFRLPVKGGFAEQLTFGPYYDTDVVTSPDGRRLAFVSDRDGSEGNVFVLDLATKEITQVTHETSAGRPAWSPDGSAIAYLSFVGEARNSPQPHKIGPQRTPTPPALVRRITLGGREPTTLSLEPELFRSIFYLPDGRLAWTVVERKVGSVSTRWDYSPDVITRIEVLHNDDIVLSLRSLNGYVDSVIARFDEGLYARRASSIWTSSREPSPNDLLFIPLPFGPERNITQIGRHRGWSPRFAIASDNESIYLGDSGKLWKVSTTSGDRERISFTAQVSLEVYEPRPVEESSLTLREGPSPPHAVLYPVVSPDGRMLVFGAAGYLWQQSLEGGPAKRLLDGNGFAEWPTYSPDGSQLAYTYSEDGTQEVRVLDFATGATRSMSAARSDWPPSWSPDGDHLIFGDLKDNRVVQLNLNDGTKEILRAFDHWPSPRPHYSPDGADLYYSDTRPLDNLNSGLGGLYSFSLNKQNSPRAVTQLEDRLIDGRVSPDGKWLAFLRNNEIWVAQFGAESLKEGDVRQLTRRGAVTFSFTADGSAVIYSSGNRVWRQALVGGEPEEIPIRLVLDPIMAPPLLLRRARVLDFDAGGFGPETSLFIEDGRIRWIDNECGKALPPDVNVLDVEGRFLIPGLFDMHIHGGKFFGEEERRLAMGITSVRSTGGPLAWSKAAMDRGETSADPVPRYFHSGRSFRQFGFSPRFLGIRDEAEALILVRRWKDLGVDHIKVYNTSSWPWMRAVTQEARRLGLRVVGHGTTVDEVTKSVVAGFTSLEHVIGPSRAYDDVLQLLAMAGTRWDPTLGVAARPTDKWEEQLASVNAAYKFGVELLIGTDQRPETFHDELGFFVEAGIDPIDVLRLATLEASEAVGVLDDLGTLDPGKLADIVLLNANPLEDIKNTQTIWRVIKGGWVFDPDEFRSE